MRSELWNYDIYPKVVPEGVEKQITIQPLGAHAAFEPGAAYTVRVIPLNERASVRTQLPVTEAELSVVPDADGCLRVTRAFRGEQEFFLCVERDGKRLTKLSIYAVADDLFGRYPFRGDLHAHTFRSDGRQSPAVAAALFRQRGYDFVSITDHHAYLGSLEAIAAYRNASLALTLVPGEEVHLPGNLVHIVNFGGRYSVNALLQSQIDRLERAFPGVSKRPDGEWRASDGAECPPPMDDETFYQAVDAIASGLTLPPDVDAFTFAACRWTYDRIREAGGLPIFAHPYWISRAYNVPVAMTEEMLLDARFGAFEVLGGERSLEQNEFQVLHYMEARAKGVNFPVVGSSDVHDLCGERNNLLAQTIVFSPANEREALISSILDRYSVAVDTISAEYRVVGELRLARYARFLLDHYFPLHDELCYEEGRLMWAYHCGAERDAGASLARLQGRTDGLRRRMFAF